MFSDDSGDYGVGCYVRNPPGTKHAPWTDPGTTILVKLRQFDMNDLRQFALDTAAATWTRGSVPGTWVLPLHQFGAENVGMCRLSAGSLMPPRDVPRGEEIYVVSGTGGEEHW